MTGKGLFLFCAILFISIDFGTSLRCYSCDNEKACKKPNKVNCNTTEAWATGQYLSRHYKFIPATNTTQFDCFSHTLAPEGFPKTVYKGCVNYNLDACNLQVRDDYVQRGYSKKCYKCTTDKCNPAGRAVLSSAALLSTVFIALFYKLY